MTHFATFKYKYLFQQRYKPESLLKIRRLSKYNKPAEFAQLFLKIFYEI